MRLALKMTAALAVGFVLVLVARGYAGIDDDITESESKYRETQELLARSFLPAIARTWRRENKDAALYLVNYVAQLHPRLHLRWVSLEPRVDSHFIPLVPSRQIKVSEKRPVSSISYESPDGRRALFTYAHLAVGIDGEADGALELWSSLPTRRDLIIAKAKEEVPRVVGFGVVAVAIALFVGTLFIWRPTQKLMVHLERVSKGDFSARVDLRQRDELGQLAKATNQMTTQLQDARNRLEAEEKQREKATEQLRHADRLSTIGQLAAGVAHELGTPLNVSAGRAKLILNSPEAVSSETKEHAAIIHRQSEKMTQIIRGLMSFARRAHSKKGDCDLVVITRQVIAMLEPMAAKKGLELRSAHLQPACHAWVDGGQVQQVVTNLIVNAIHASEAGTVTVQCNAEPNGYCNNAPNEAETTFVSLAVTDQGVGMPADIMPHIFDPFFTTKETGEGTGLGLSVSHGIVMDHGGWIDATTKVGEGTSFVVYLPGVSASA